MKCNNLLCPNYQSDMHDNCKKLGQMAKDCETLKSQKPALNYIVGPWKPFNPKIEMYNQGE